MSEKDHQLAFAIGNAFAKRDMTKRLGKLRGTPLTSLQIGARTYNNNDASAAYRHLKLAGEHRQLTGITIRMSF